MSVIMEKDAKAFLATLFDKEEHICMADNPFGVESRPISGYSANYPFFCINPLLPGGTRRDSHVSVYRNILLEFDHGTIDEQWEIINQIPASSVVSSGGKSLHAIISLKTPCTDREAYRRLVQRIYAKVPQADKANSNPSRFSRMANATRDNGKFQGLLRLRGRVSHSTLEAWLGPEVIEQQEPQEARVATGLTKWTKFFIAFGAEKGEWNSALFKASCDMARNGMEKNQIIMILSTVTGYLDSSDRRTIDSACRTVKGD